MNKFMKRLAKNEGFTLVELIVVIAILAILAAVATAGYSGYIKSANEAADGQALEAVNTAIASALALEGENTTDAPTYFDVDFDSATKTVTITPIDQDTTVAGVQNVVWENFTEFNNLATGATSATVTFKGYTALDGNFDTTGVLAGA